MLINCTLYQHGKKIQDLPIADISEALKVKEAFVWVALHNSNREEMEAMRLEFNLHPLAIEDALHGYQRSKLEEYGEIVFIVVPAPEYRDGNLSYGEVHLFVGPQFVLSIRQNCEQGFANIRQRCESEPDLLKLGSGFVCYALIDTLVDRIFPLVESLEDQFDFIEGNLFTAPAGQQQIESLYRLKQKTMKVKHAVDPLMESISKLCGGRVPKVVAGTQDYFRDVSDHLLRINQSLESVRDSVGTAIQVNLALVGLRESEINKRLAGWAALIGVPTLVAGIYGMNFHHMPELDYELGYPLCILFMILADSYLYYRFKKTGWI